MGTMIRRSLIGMMVTAAVALIAACGGGGGGSGGCPTTEPTSCMTGLSGQWEVYDTISTSSPYCDDGSNTYTATVTQTGCRLTVEIDEYTFTGFVDGDTLCWTGEYSYMGGTTTITDMEVTANADGTEFTGSSSWTWTDGTGDCEGTTSTHGYKI